MPAVSIAQASQYSQMYLSLCAQLGHPGASGSAAARGKRAQTRALSVQPSPVLDTMQRVIGLALAVGLVRLWKRFVFKVARQSLCSLQGALTNV